MLAAEYDLIKLAALQLGILMKINLTEKHLPKFSERSFAEQLWRSSYREFVNLTSNVSFFFMLSCNSLFRVVSNIVHEHSF